MHCVLQVGASEEATPAAEAGSVEGLRSCNGNFGVATRRLIDSLFMQSVACVRGN